MQIVGTIILNTLTATSVFPRGTRIVTSKNTPYRL